MNSKTKKLLIFLGTLFVAISFISGYASVNNNYNISSTSTTSVPAKADFASGVVNGIVSGYSNSATLRLNGSTANSNTANEVSGLLVELQDNGTINSYDNNGFNNSYQVFLSTINAYQFAELVNSKLSSNTITIVNASSTVTLPSKVTLSVNGQQVPNILLTLRNYSVNLSPLKAINSTVRVKINTLVWLNGTQDSGGGVTIIIVNE